MSQSNWQKFTTKLYLFDKSFDDQNVNSWELHKEIDTRLMILGKYTQAVLGI
jgi:hypothetical protein